MLHVAVRGRVQGVGFRWFVRERARELQLAGWVRNLPDGSVEVFAEGERDALEHFQRLLKSGPPGAVVASVDTVGGAARDEAKRPFGILR
jgi:acylphosphatase